MEHGIRLVKEKLLLIIWLVMGILFIVPMEVKAEETVVFKNITGEEAKQVLKAINIRACDINKLKKLPIEELLVSDDWLAIGVQGVIGGKSENAVGVFDTKGNLKYAVTFDTTGTHGLIYDNESDSLVIYIPRANTYYTFNSNGALIQIEGFDSKKGIKKTDAKFVDSEGNEYFLSSGIGIGKLFVTDKTIVIRKNTDGNQSVFFQTDYSSYGSILKVLPIILIICIVLFLECKYSIFSKQ